MKPMCRPPAPARPRVLTPWLCVCCVCAVLDAQYRGSGETLKREEFEARKKAAEEAKASKLRNAPKKLASADKDLSHFPFLHNLAEREDLVRNGKLTSIIFLRDKNSKGQEVSVPTGRQ
jgi:hypothetical protein